MKSAARLAPFVLLPGMLIAQPAPVVQERDKASLEGHVLNAATGTPIRKARLTLRMNAAAPQTVRQSQAATQPAAITALSDAGGKFLFANLEPGDYQLMARHDGFGDVRLGVRDGSRKVEQITLAAADRKTGLTVKMTPHGAITGRLSDEDGDPVPKQHVALQAYQYTTRGRELVETSHMAATDDLGEYRIFNVPPGRYFFRAGRPEDRTRRLEDGEEGFLPTYFPGTQDGAGAAPIDLAAGQQLRGINLILRRARLAVIRGRVIVPEGATAEAGILVTSDVGASSTSGSTEKDGKFEFTVAPGRLYLIGGYSLQGRRHRVYLPVQVGTTDIAGIELRPLPPMEVTGQVRVEGQGDLKPPSLIIGLQAPGRSVSTPAREGVVTFREVEPFIYRVTLNNMQNMYLKTVSWGTADVTDGEIDLTGGVPARTELTVVLGADAGQVEGTVKNDRSEPIDGAMVTLVPVGSRRARAFKVGSTNPQGHFMIQGVAPGSYKAYAWDTVNTNAVAHDPDFLRPYETAGQGIEIGANEKKSVDLKLTLNKSQ